MPGKKIKDIQRFDLDEASNKKDAYLVADVEDQNGEVETFSVSFREMTLLLRQTMIQGFPIPLCFAYGANGAVQAIFGLTKKPLNGRSSGSNFSKNTNETHKVFVWNISPFESGDEIILNFSNVPNSAGRVLVYADWYRNGTLNLVGSIEDECWDGSKEIVFYPPALSLLSHPPVFRIIMGACYANNPVDGIACGEVGATVMDVYVKWSNIISY